VLIILHGAGERNRGNRQSGHEGSEFVGRALQRTAERGCPYMNSLGANYFGVAGVVALGFGCLAMIWSLILS
jgi:hypothetical protein